MHQVLLNLYEIDRIKRANGIYTTVELAKRTAGRVSRNTWTRALKDREPRPDVLNELAALGARIDQILVSEVLHEDDKPAA